MTRHPSIALKCSIPVPSSQRSILGDVAARTSAYPRVLIINTRPLGKKYPVGITLSHLFSGWPPDRIAQIYVGDGGDLDNTVCHRHWALTVEDVRMPSLHRLGNAWRSRRSNARGTAVALSRESLGSTPGQSGNVSGRLKTAIRSALIYGAQRLESYRLSRKLRQWLNDFKPEVIYTILESPQITAFVMNVSKEYRIPVVPHFMDDWLTISLSGAAQKGLCARRLRKNALEIMAKAPVRMVIGARMAEEYRKRYGGTFLPFMNCIEVDSYGPPSRSRGRKIVFAYCGGFHLNRWRQLRDIGNALCELRTIKIDAELHVSFGAAAEDVIKELGAIDSIRCVGSLPLAEVASVMSNADCLVYVESFEEDTKAYMRYSMSAKLPEYFRAGRPVLAYGPSDIASIQYIQQTGAGVIVSKPNAKTLRDALQRLIQDEDLRIALGKHAYCAAKERHNAVNVREEFRNAITSAVREHNEASQCS